MRSFVRVNHKIRVPNVRCIRSDGEMAGVLSTRDALKLAQDEGLDLVEISPNADPPVCRIMDFGKFRYDEGMKRKQSRKQSRAHNKALKEIKFHVNVAEHDYETKVNHARKFLEKGHKVKLSLQFRGRENAHRELGFELIQRVLKDLEEMCVVDSAPKMMGRSIVAHVGSKSKK
ncbi:translation initiation factor IF-3 [bacterium E08(2017)]|nr:translation initiation factor IF-3 [bacterium E08(2017)]